VVLLLRPVPLLLLLIHAGQLLLLLIQRLLFLVSIYQLLPLVPLDLDILAALLLVLQPVLFQLGNKVNNYFPSRLANFRIQIRFSLNSP
jgi:hypothetical protein